MPKVLWRDVPLSDASCLIVWRLAAAEEEFALSGLPLRSAGDLLARVCAKLGLQDRYAIQGARTPELEIRCTFESYDDARKFVQSAGMPHPGKRRCTFSFDRESCAKLLAIGGPPRRPSRRECDETIERDASSSTSRRGPWRGRQRHG